MKKNGLVYTMTAYDDSRIYARRADVSAICAECNDCDGEDIESGAGCITAFCELAYKNLKLVYKKE